LALKEKFHDLAAFLVNTKHFDLKKINQRSGFDYFSYAVVKGQLPIAHLIKDQLEEQGFAKADICNPVIYSDDTNKTTLFDLCIQKKFRLGTQFLYNVCGVKAPEEKKEVFNELMVTMYALKMSKAGANSAARASSMGITDASGRNTDHTSYD